MSTKTTPKTSAVAARSGRRPGTDQGAFASVLHDVLGSVSESERDDFVASVVGPEVELDPALWGREPSVSERRSASLANLRLEFEARRAVLDQSLTRSEVAELLEVSEQAILDRLEAGALIGLKKGREWRLPAWQFSPDAERGFVPGLAELQRVFPGGPVTLSGWATSPNTELGGATPAAQLAAGNVDRVVLVAESLTSAAW